MACSEWIVLQKYWYKLLMQFCFSKHENLFCHLFSETVLSETESTSVKIANLIFSTGCSCTTELLMGMNLSLCSLSSDLHSFFKNGVIGFELLCSSYKIHVAKIFKFWPFFVCFVSFPISWKWHLLHALICLFSVVGGRPYFIEEYLWSRFATKPKTQWAHGKLQYLFFLTCSFKS